MYMYILHTQKVQMVKTDSQNLNLLALHISVCTLTIYKLIAEIIRITHGLLSKELTVKLLSRESITSMECRHIFGFATLLMQTVLE